MPTLTIPTLDFSGVDLAKFEMPKVEMKTIEFPTFNWSKFDWPSFEMPSVELPEIELDKLADAAKNAVYLTVGLGVPIGQQVQERTRDLATVVAEQFETMRDQMDTVRKRVRSAVATVV